MDARGLDQQQLVTEGWDVVYFGERYKEPGLGSLIVARYGYRDNGNSVLAANTTFTPPPVTVPGPDFLCTAIYASAIDANGLPTPLWDFNWGVTSDGARNWKIQTIPDGAPVPASCAAGGRANPLYIAPTLMKSGADIRWVFATRDQSLSHVEVVFIGELFNPELSQDHTYADAGYYGCRPDVLNFASSETIGLPSSPPQQTTLDLGAARFDTVFTALSTFSLARDTQQAFASVNLVTFQFSVREMFGNRALMAPSQRFASSQHWASTSFAPLGFEYSAIELGSSPFPGAGMSIPQNSGLFVEAFTQALPAGQILEGTLVFHGYRVPSVRGARA